MAPRHSSQGLLVHPLSHVRAVHGWTYQDVVDIVARRLGNAAARREKAWRWEHAGVVPDHDSQIALAAELGVPVTEVEQRGWPGWLPDGDPIPTAFAWDAEGSLQSIEDALEHAMLDRRGFMKLLGPVLVGLAEDWLAIEPPELAAVLRGGRITDDFVRRMEEGLPRLRMLEAERGGDRARKLIDAELGMVSEVIGRSTYTSRVAIRLYALAAELGRMAGWASFDAGMHAAAQRYWVGALHAAHASGQNAVGANILKSMSLQCCDFNKPKEALMLARRAHEGALDVTPRTDAMLSMREARAHALLGDRLACENLIASAEGAMARADGRDEDPTWVAYFDDAEFHAQVGSCFLDLDNYIAADRHFEAALALFPAEKVRDHATYLIRRSSARAGLGDSEHAAQLLAEAVPLIRQAPSGRNVQRARDARAGIPGARKTAWSARLDHELSALVA